MKIQSCLISILALFGGFCLGYGIALYRRGIDTKDYGREKILQAKSIRWGGYRQILSSLGWLAAGAFFLGLIIVITFFPLGR